jgi:hypothetical protein
MVSSYILKNKPAKTTRNARHKTTGLVPVKIDPRLVKLDENTELIKMEFLRSSTQSPKEKPVR